MIDQESKRIEEDLRGLVAGDVLCDDIFLELYASDASIYEIRPRGVVRPRSTADVVACVEYAKENQIPIHARGAGSGLAGQALGPGLVLDFSKYMRRIIDSGTQTVRLQPGVVHAQLNKHLRRTGRQFGPDPATSNVTTMGGVIAVDSGGSHWLRYGSARRHVKQLQVVLADGKVIEVGREKIESPPQNASSDASSESDTRRRDLTSQLAELLQRNEGMITQYQCKSLVNCSGYQLYGVLRDGYLDIAKLLVGSEGTLALITEATLDTVPLPSHRGAALLMFDRMENAAKAVQTIVSMNPSVCDLMDRRHLGLARESVVHYNLLIPPDAEALLLVEFDDDDLSVIREKLDQLTDRIKRQLRLAFHSHQTTDEDEVHLYWQLAHKVVPTLHRLKGSNRPLPFIEDIAIPPERLPEFLVRLQNTLKRHHITASLFAHAGHGQLHLRPLLDLSKQDDVQRMKPLADDLYAQVIDFGGTISGEHGDGLSRSSYIRQQYGPLYDVFCEVKQIFDPQNIFNPGKIISELGLASTRLTDHLRPVTIVRAEAESAGSETSPRATGLPVIKPLELHLNWTLDEIAHVALSCNGCGVCRSLSADVRMCPINRFAPVEESSPRAKANLVRAILTGQLDPQIIQSDEFKQIADLCVHCHMCRLECPASVDIPKLMVEAKAAYVANNGLPGHWFLTHIDVLSRWASRFRMVANWSLGNRQARWLIEKFFGIAQGRKLPRLSRKSFLRRAARRRLTRPPNAPGRKVLYFVDTYANYHDAQLAEALVAILQHHDVAVYVHPDQKQAGMSLIANGALDSARRIAQHNVTLLAEAVRQGYHIVATEPSAALCLKHEYPWLLADDDTQLVAENSSEACTYLWKMHQDGSLKLDFKPISATLAYHMPCHVKALDVGSPSENLLRLIPGLRAPRTERGCSGMAGVFGLRKKNYRASLRAGWGLISSIRDPGVQAGTTECSTCKIQMEQGTTKPTIHPLKLLALAYGLMPEVASLLEMRGEELIVT